MLEKLVTNMITSYLGKYIDNLDRKNVSVSLWNGSVDLTNLKVRTSALRGMNLPISVKEGRVGNLKVRIPWTRLQSEPVIFSITDLIIILHPKSAALYDEEAEEEERLAYKREQLEQLDHMRQAGVKEVSNTAAKPSSAATDDATTAAGTSATDDASAAGPSSQHLSHVSALEKAKDTSFSSRLKASMLSNAQLEVKNIIIMYEDMVTDPTLPVHFTIRLDEFSVHSCTADNEPTFSNPTDKLLYKLLQCKSFRVDLDMGKRGNRGEGGKSIADIIAKVQEELKEAKSAAAKAAAAPLVSTTVDQKHQCIVRPTDFRLRLQHQPIPYDLQVPKWLATAKIPNAEVCIDRQQWDCVWRSVKYVERYEDVKAFFRFRPPSDAHWTPFLRWQFAINATLHVVRRRMNRNRIKWSELIERKQLQNAYVDLYRRAQPEAADWALPLTEEEREKVKAIEKALPLEMLRAGRKLAYAKLDMEKQQYEKRVEYHARQEARRERRLQRKGLLPEGAGGGGDDSNSTGTKVGWLAWMTGSYVKPQPIKRDILDICDESGTSAHRSSGGDTTSNAETAASDDDEDDEDKTKFTEEEASAMYGILDAKKWSSAQRKILADEFGMAWEEDEGGLPADVAAMMAMEGADIAAASARSRRHHAFKLQRDGIRAGSIEDDEGAPPPTSQRELYDLSASFEIVRLNIVLMDYKRCPFADFTLEGAVLTYHSTKSTLAAHLALRKVHVVDASIPNSRPIISAAQGRAIAPHPSCPRQNMFVLKVQRLDKAAPNSGGIDLNVAFSSAPFDVCFMVPWMQQVVSFWGEDELKALNKAAAAAAAANRAAQRNGVGSANSNPNNRATSGTMGEDGIDLNETGAANKLTDATVVAPRPTAGSPLVQLLMATERSKINNITVSLHGMRLLIPEARKSRDSDTVFVKQEAALELPLLILQNDSKFALERRKVLARVRAKLRNNDRPELITQQLYPEGVEAAHYCNNFYLQIKDLRIGTSYLDPTVQAPRKPEIISHYILTKASLNITLKKLIVKDNYDVAGTGLDISIGHELCVEGPRKMWLVLLNAVTLILEFNNNKNGKGSKMVEQGKVFRRGESGEPFHARVIGPRQRFIYADEDVRPLNQQLQTFSPVQDQDRYVVCNFGALLMFHAERPSMPFLQMELRQNAFTVVPHTLDDRDLKRNRIHKDYIYYDEEEDANGEAKKGRVHAVTVYIHSGGADHAHRKGLFAARELLGKYNIPLFNALPHQHQAVEFVTSLLASTKKISQREVADIINAYQIVQNSFHTNPCEAVTFVFTTEAEQLKFAAEVSKNASPEGFVAPPAEGLAYRGELAPPLPIQNQRSMNLNINVPGIRLSIVEPPVRMTDGSGALSAPLVSSLELREKVNIAFFTTMFRRSLTLSADTLTLYAPSAKYFRSYELNTDGTAEDDRPDENGVVRKKKAKPERSSSSSGGVVDNDNDDEESEDDLLEDEVRENEAIRRKGLEQDEYGVFKDVNQLVKRLRTQRGSDVYSHAAALVKELMGKFLANDSTASGCDVAGGPSLPTAAAGPQHQRTQSASINNGGVPSDLGSYAFDSAVAELLDNPATSLLGGAAAAAGGPQIGGNLLLSGAPTIKFSLVNFFHERGSKRREIGEEDKESERTALFADAMGISGIGGGQLLEEAVQNVLQNPMDGSNSIAAAVQGSGAPAHRRSESLSTLHNTGGASAAAGGAGGRFGAGLGAASSMAASSMLQATAAAAAALTPAQRERMTKEYEKLWGGRTAASRAVLDADGIVDLRPVFRIHHPNSNVSHDTATTLRGSVKLRKRTADITTIVAELEAQEAREKAIAEGLATKEDFAHVGNGDEDDEFDSDYSDSDDGFYSVDSSADATCFIHFVGSWLPRTTPILRIESNTDVSLAMDEPLMHAVELFFDLMDALTMKSVGMTSVFGCRFSDDRYLPMRKYSKVHLTAGGNIEDRYLGRDDYLAMNGILSSAESKGIDSGKGPVPPMIPPFSPDGLVDGICIDLDFRRKFVMETMHDYSLIATRPAQPQPLPPDRQAAADVQLAQDRAARGLPPLHSPSTSVTSPLPEGADALSDTRTSATSGGGSPSVSAATPAPTAAAAAGDPSINHAFLERLPQGITSKHHPVVRLIAEKGVMIRWRSSAAMNSTKVVARRPYLMVHKYVGRTQEQLATMKFPSGWQHQDRLLPQGQHGALYEVMAMPKKRAANISETTYVGKSSGASNFTPPNPATASASSIPVAGSYSVGNGNTSFASNPTSSKSRKSMRMSMKGGGGGYRKSMRGGGGGIGVDGSGLTAPNPADQLNPLGDGSLTFEFQILYKPRNMAQQDWALLASTSGTQVANPRDVLTKRMAAKTVNGSGYMFTHFLTLMVEDMAMNYVQSTVWPLLEHFSNGFITRSGYMTQRGQLSLATPLADRQWSWRRILAHNDKVAAALDGLIAKQSFPSNNPNTPKPSPSTGAWHLNRPCPIKNLSFYPHSCASRSDPSIVPPYGITMLHQNIELRSVDCILPFHEDHCANILARADSIGMWSEIQESQPHGFMDTSALDFSGLAVPMSTDAMSCFKMAFEGMRMWVATDPTLAFMAQQTSNQHASAAAASASSAGGGTATGAAAPGNSPSNPSAAGAAQQGPLNRHQAKQIRTAANAKTLWELSPGLTQSALPHMRVASHVSHHSHHRTDTNVSDSSLLRAGIVGGLHHHRSISSSTIDQSASAIGGMAHPPVAIGGVVSNAKSLSQGAILHTSKPSDLPMHIRIGSGGLRGGGASMAALDELNSPNASGANAAVFPGGGGDPLTTPPHQAAGGPHGATAAPRSIVANANTSATRARTKTVMIEDPNANFRHEPTAPPPAPGTRNVGGSSDHHSSSYGGGNASSSTNESVVNVFPADFSTCLLGLTSVPTSTQVIHNPDGSKHYVCKITATARDMTEVVSGMRCEFSIFWELNNPHQRLSEKHMNLQFGDFMFHGSSKQLAAVCDWVCGVFMEPYVPQYPAKYQQPKAYVVWSQWIEKHHPDIFRAFSAPHGADGVSAAMRVLSPLSSRTAGEWTIGAQRMCIHLQDPETKIRSARIIDGSGGGADASGGGRRRAVSRAPAGGLTASPSNSAFNTAAAADPLLLQGPSIVRDPINVVFDISKGAHMNIKWQRDTSFKSRYAFGAISGWDLTMGALRSGRKGNSKFVDNVREVVTSRRRFLRIEHNAPWKRRLHEGSTNGFNNSSTSTAAGGRNAPPTPQKEPRDDFVDNFDVRSNDSGRSRHQYPASQLAARSKAALGPNVSANALPAVKPTTVQLLDGLAFDLSTAGLDVFYGYTTGGPEEKLVYCDLTVDSLDLQLIPRFMVDLKDSLLSLTVRNSMAPMFKWPCYAIGQAPIPPDPTAQQWRSENNFKVKAIYLVLLEDPRARKPLPLYFITMRGIGFKNSSEACQLNKALHFTVEGISSNGLVTDRDTVVPLIAMQSAENEEQRRITNLIDVTKDKDGLRGVIGCLWFLSPLKHKLLQLKAAATHPSMSELSWLSSYAEERSAMLLGNTQLADAAPSAGGPPPTTPAPSAENPRENDMHIVIHNPRLVIAEHSTLELTEKEGITINFGTIEILKVIEEVEVAVSASSNEPAVVGSPTSPRGSRNRRTPVSPTAADENGGSSAPTRDVVTRYKAVISKVNIASLRPDEEGNERFLLYPADISAAATISSNGLTTDASVDLKAVRVDIEKDDYEWALHAATRHLVADEDNLISKKEAQAIATTANTTSSAASASKDNDSEYSKTTHTAPGISLRTFDPETGEVRRRLMSLRKRKATSIIAAQIAAAAGLAGITDGVPLISIPVQNLRAKVSLQAFNMRVHSDTVAVFVNLAAVKAEMAQSKPKLPEGLQASTTIPVSRDKDGADTILAARTPLSVESEQMRRSVMNRPTMSKGNDSDDSDNNDDGNVDIAANPTVRQSVVVGSRMLDTSDTPLLVVPPTTMTIEASLGRLAVGVEGSMPLLSLTAPNAESIRFASSDYKMTVDAAIGTMKCALEHRSVVQAIQFLYEPYRRIVLPRYGLAQILTYSHCYNELHSRLVLSGRTVACFSNKEFNHITINANGNEIHFIEAGRPILVLDAGMTVYFTNAKLHLYGHLLEHFTVAGNGSYVIVDDTCEFVEPHVDSSSSSESDAEELLSAGNSDDEDELEFEDGNGGAGDAFGAVDYPQSVAHLYPNTAATGDGSASFNTGGVDSPLTGSPTRRRGTAVGGGSRSKRAAPTLEGEFSLGGGGGAAASGMNTTPPPEPADLNTPPPQPAYVLPLLLPRRLQPSSRQIDARGSFEVMLPEFGGVDPNYAAAAQQQQSNANNHNDTNTDALAVSVKNRNAAPPPPPRPTYQGSRDKIRRALSVKMKLIVGHRQSMDPSVDAHATTAAQQAAAAASVPTSPSHGPVGVGRGSPEEAAIRQQSSTLFGMSVLDGFDGTIRGSNASGVGQPLPPSSLHSPSRPHPYLPSNSVNSGGGQFLVPAFTNVTNEQACAFLTDLHAECEYFGPNGTDRIDYTTLITPWEMRVSIIGSDAPMPTDDARRAHDLAATYGANSTSAQQTTPTAAAGGNNGLIQQQQHAQQLQQQQPPSVMRRKIFLEADSRVEFRFRYGDISLVASSVDQLKQAFGHIEQEVINAAPAEQNGFEHLSKVSKEEQQKTAAKASVMTIVTTVKQVALVIVDDSMFGAHTNVPLMSLIIGNIVTPVLEMSSYTTKIHISAELEIQYYNLNNGAWASLLETVPFDFVLRSNKNVTMEDVVMRKGNQKAGLKFRALNLHVTPVLIQVVSRLLALKKRLADLTAEGRGTAADAKAAAAEKTAEANSEDPSNAASFNNSFNMDPRAKKRDQSSHNTFYAYTVTQQLGHDVEIEFCTSLGVRRAEFKRQRIASQGSVSFDYPRDRTVVTEQATESTATNEYPIAEHCINVIVRKGDSGFSEEDSSVTGSGNSLNGAGAVKNAVPYADGHNSEGVVVLSSPKESSSNFNSSVRDGREASPDSNQHVGRATVWLSKVGQTFINVGIPTKPRYIIVDVVVSQGTKRVLLRTNVSFTNKLPFGVSFKQVGCIQPGKTVTVPRETLRKRCTFLPTVPGGAPDEICMGVSYDALHDFYDQRFLCTARIRKPRSDLGAFGAFKKTHVTGFNTNARAAGAAANPAMVPLDDVFVADSNVEHAYYMVLGFDTLKTIPSSDIVDCHATLEAPFNIVNATGQPIRVTMHYRQIVPKKGFFRSEEFTFPKIDRIAIDTEERYPVTQVDPFEDMYISLEIGQPTGDGLTSHRKSKHCVMIRSTHSAKDRATSVKLVDSRGEELELAIEYNGRDIVFSCPFWVINQTQHYLQITTTTLKKRQNCLVAGMSGDGLGPSVDTPFLIHTPKMKKDPMSAHLYIRVGRMTASGEGIMWSQWSDKVFINAVGDLSIITCPTANETVTLSYSVALVGGMMKSTRVVKITPRWIVINRLKHPITINQNTVKADQQPPPISVQQQKARRALAANASYSPDDTIGCGLLKVLDTCAPIGTNNTISLRHGDGATSSTFCAPISIERLGDHAINLLYMAEVPVNEEANNQTNGANNTAAPKTDGSTSATNSLVGGASIGGGAAVVGGGGGRSITYERSYVVHVTCYSRASTLFICVDEPEKPPHLIENRTRFQINVRQRDTSRTVVVYRFHTLGFVWEDPQAPKVLQMWMSEGNAASKPITINLDPSMLVKRKHQLSQVIRTLGGIDLYVRVRAYGGSYAISVTEDTLIDRARALPFQQYRYQLQIDAINLLAADTGRDILLLTIGHKGGGVSFSVSQHRVREDDTDEQLIEVSYGVIQLSDEQYGAQQRVVMQTLMNRASTIKICRRLQRMTPMLQVTTFEVAQQPVTIHLADSFLYGILHFVDSVQVAVGKTVEVAKQSVFATTPWYVELTTPIASQDSIQNRVAFVEKMNISQITISISLYRGDGSIDPIGDRLGSIVSMLIRSVSDARFDWRRIEYDNIYDRMWLLVTFLTNYYSTELQRQLLNVVHVAGLDVMRGFVTDLLEGYFTSNAPVSMASSKASALIPLRDEIRFRQETNNLQHTEATTHPAHMAQIRQLALLSRATNVTSSLAARDSSLSTGALGTSPSPSSANFKEVRHGGLLGRVEKVQIDAYAEKVPFADFIANVTKSEFRQFGHLAIRQYLRTRDFSISPLLMCNRCLDVEVLREAHAEGNYNSILPHPSSRHISWAELAHHASWEEMTELLSAEELHRHAETIKAGIAGMPCNVVRIDAEMERSIRQEVVGVNTIDGSPNPAAAMMNGSGSGDSPTGSPRGTLESRGSRAPSQAYPYPPAPKK